MQVDVAPALGVEGDLAFLDDADRRLGERLHPHEPLIRQVGLDDRLAAVVATDRQGVRLDGVQQAVGLETREQLSSTLETVESGERARNVVHDPVRAMTIGMSSW